jgi:hypothetical protein
LHQEAFGQQTDSFYIEYIIDAVSVGGEGIGNEDVDIFGNFQDFINGVDATVFVFGHEHNGEFTVIFIDSGRPFFNTGIHNGNGSIFYELPEVSDLCSMLNSRNKGYLIFGSIGMFGCPVEIGIGSWIDDDRSRDGESSLTAVLAYGMNEEGISSVGETNVDAVALMNNTFSEVIGNDGSRGIEFRIKDLTEGFTLQVFLQSKRRGGGLFNFYGEGMTDGIGRTHDIISGNVENGVAHTLSDLIASGWP